MVVFIPFLWVGLPGYSCDAATASSIAVEFLLSSFSLGVACLVALFPLSFSRCSLSRSSLPFLSSELLASGPLLLVVLCGWLARFSPSFFFFCAPGYSSVIGYSLCLILMVYRLLRSAFSYAASWLRLSALLK